MSRREHPHRPRRSAVPRPRRRRRWQDTGEDDHFAGDSYFDRWLDEDDPERPATPGRPRAAGADRAGDEMPLPRRRDVYSDDMALPLWWRIWRWWR